MPESNIVLRSDQINSGYDSLGALMYFRNGNKLRTLWTGTILSNEQIKEIGI
jgi:homospermidine synthase